MFSDKSFNREPAALVIDIHMPHSKCCHGKSVSLRKGASGITLTHAAKALSAKIDNSKTVILGHSTITFVAHYVSNKTRNVVAVLRNIHLPLAGSLITTQSTISPHFS